LILLHNKIFARGLEFGMKIGYVNSQTKRSAPDEGSEVKDLTGEQRGWKPSCENPKPRSDSGSRSRGGGRLMMEAKNIQFNQGEGLK